MQAEQADSQLSADSLRAMGIDHELLAKDEDLVATVALLLDVGYEIDELINADLTYMAPAKLLRPDATIYPGEELVDDADRDFAARTALALGFIANETESLTPAEVETIRFLQTLRPILGEDEDLFAVLRVMGTSMARLARSVVTTLRLRYETPIMEETESLIAVAHAYRAVTEDLLPPFLEATSTVLRRHLAVAASQQTIWNVDRSHAATMEQITVGFVDLVGFTSFTEQADLSQFVEALTTFEAEAQDVIVGNGGTLVKLIGDEAMFVAPTAASGVEIARRLANLSLSDTGPASVRIALAAGEIVAIGGDYYGTVVNIASRSVNEAEPDTIVVTAQVANGAHASARFIELGPRMLRGISEPVPLFQLVR